jgi:hypothetical protein
MRLLRRSAILLTLAGGALLLVEHGDPFTAAEDHTNPFLPRLTVYTELAGVEVVLHLPQTVSSRVLWRLGHGWKAMAPM